MGPDGGEDTRVFGKDCTVILNVGDNKRIKATDVMRDMDSKYGKGSVYACVPKSGDCFEVTMASKIIAEKLSVGVLIADKNCECGLLFSDIMVVSFMHLPAYITDAEIKLKLASYGIALKSKIKRRYYRGTRCADGTRYVKVEFPPHIKSLNYLMKFDTVYGPQMFRVKHNNQTKVCSLCLSDEHLMKQCPDFKCFRCGVQGHAKYTCDAERCQRCKRYPVNCKCQANGDENDVIDDVDDTDQTAQEKQHESSHSEQSGELDDVEDASEKADEFSEASESCDDYANETIHDSDMEMGEDEEEFIPGSNDIATSLDLNDVEDDITNAAIGDGDEIATPCESYNAQESAFLVEFSTLPVESLPVNGDQAHEGDNFTPAPSTVDDNNTTEGENIVHATCTEDEIMELSSDCQVDRRQKRKSVEKSREDAKRVKEVTKGDTQNKKNV